MGRTPEIQSIACCFARSFNQMAVRKLSLPRLGNRFYCTIRNWPSQPQTSFQYESERTYFDLYDSIVMQQQEQQSQQEDNEIQQQASMEKNSYSENNHCLWWTMRI